jgi:hypothetical protein
MADLLLACQRPGRRPPLAAGDILRAAGRVAPGNITPRPARLVEAPGLLIAALNPGPGGVDVRQGGARVGGLIGDPEAWWQTASAAPDGTYAMIRYDDASVELLSDTIATRTLWYVVDDSVFPASTSQRALVVLLGSFELDPQAVAWMMSAGYLGPETSWDARLTRLPGNSRLTFDRTSWRAHVDTRPTPFSPVARDRVAHAAALRDALSWSCAQLDIDVDRWILPLSGGRDSRALLAFMVRGGRRPRCVTWTTRASARAPLSDASIARHVARRFGVEHEVVYLDGDDDLVAALDRFVEVAEGRTDELSGYTDGCRVWADLFAGGVAGVIRGDESAGIRRRAASPAAARANSAGAMVSDFPPAHLLRHLDLAEQGWPPRLRQQPDEALDTYRDRMYEQSRLPGALAALNDLKGRYVEVVNPLLSRRMIEVVHSLPDALRAYGRVYNQVVDPEGGLIPYARSVSTRSVAACLDDPRLIEEIVTELSSVRVERVLDHEEAVMRLLVRMATPRRGPTAPERLRAVLRTARKALPQRVARRLTPPYSRPDPVSAARVGLRATIASKTVALFREDASLLRDDATLPRADGR